ncbi:MAG: cardiolipin synthase [Pirellulales bacterium]|nr:cardiolipin synthase [Pirellulales bacterium]
MNLSLAEIWFYSLTILDVVLASWTTVHAVLNKRDSRAAIGWVGLAWLSPFIGCILYFCFGVNRIERKATSLRLTGHWHHPRYTPLLAKDLAQYEAFKSQYPTHADLEVLVQKLTGRPAFPGNDVRALYDGDQAYPSMLEAIDSAKHSIALLSYIFDNDRAGQAFRERLIAAKERGVEIRVLVDDVGSRYSRPNMIEQLKKDGIRAERFMPTRVPRMFKYANLRNHRKILVVDGRIGFTGGTNIREGHWLSLSPDVPVSCLHFRFEGPVVENLQEVFAFDWAFATGEFLEGDLWFPKIERTADIWARGISGGPDEHLDKMPLTIIGALTAARRSVRIVTPYFLPEQPIVQALITAALRGIDVRIMIPSENNIPPVHWAACTTLPYLMDRGCRVYLSPPPFDHTKLLLVDGLWSLVGSTNWDPRSLRLNFEFNVECYSPKLGEELQSFVTNRLTVSRELSAKELRARPLLIRLRDGFARLFSPYL